MAKPVEVVFFDCDDCLYQNNWATAQKITDSIAAYTKKLGVSKEKAYELYQTHGTCIKGLLLEGILDEGGVEDFLITVHQISYEDITPDPALRLVVEKVVPKRFVFTASAREHAERCLDKIGIKDLFLGIVDTRVCKLETKHSDAAFKAAMAFADVKSAESCVLIDDSVKNIQAAKRQGWQTVLVGMTSRDTGEQITCPEADYHIPRMHDLPKVMPALFAAGGATKSIEVVAAPEGATEMKVTTKRNPGFYANSACSFFRGIDAKPAEENKPAREAKLPVENLRISGLGDAVTVAVIAAAKVVAEGLADISKTQTAYPELDSSGRGHPQIFIDLKKK